MSTFEEHAVEYVMKHARYSATSPRLKYNVRYPPTASRAFLAEDTRDLVLKVAKKMEDEFTAKLARYSP